MATTTTDDFHTVYDDAAVDAVARLAAAARGTEVMDTGSGLKDALSACHCVRLSIGTDSEWRLRYGLLPIKSCAAAGEQDSAADG